MTEQLKQFIKENRDLINQNSKESWEEIYGKLDDSTLKGEFTNTILSSGINDPAAILGYIPKRYLYRSKIQGYVIPDSVTTIGYNAFHYCRSLTSVVIGDSVTSIDDDTFSYCESLTSVVIPDSVTSIGDAAFIWCENLKEIKFKGTKKDAITRLKVRNESWRKLSSIKKIICSDGVIEL